MSYPQYVFSISISGTYDLTVKQIVNCRQNKTHSRKQVLKYVNLVKSRSKPPGPPTRALPLTHWGLQRPLTPRRNYAYTSICSSYAPVMYKIDNINAMKFICTNYRRVKKNEYKCMLYI